MCAYLQYSKTTPKVTLLYFEKKPKNVRFQGGSKILQGRVSNPSARGTGGRAPKERRSVGSGRGLCPSPENFCISYIKMVSFYAFPENFIVTATPLTTCFEHIFKKGTLINRGCVRTPWTPLDPPLGFRYHSITRRLRS